MKIAIVANGMLTRNEAPFGTDWQMWGIGHPTYRLSWQDRYHRIYEPHNPINPEYIEVFEDPDYLKFIKDHKVVCHDKLPWEQIRNIASPDGFESTMAIMIALAILEMPDEIGVWGVDARIMKQQEYETQWPNILWLLGIAKGCGIKVTVPARSGLFTKGDYGS